MDQLAALEKAVENGFEKIALTLTGENAHHAAALREREEELGARAMILSVHTTGISETQAEILAESCDLVWSCASRAVREVAGRASILQMGISIPVFAFTLAGKRLLLNRALHFKSPLVMHRAALPLAPEGKQPRPLV